MLVFLWVFLSVLSINTMTVLSIAGSHFVASCPWLRLQMICEALITSEVKVYVKIKEVSGNNSTLKVLEKTLVVERETSKKYKLGKGTKKFPISKTKFTVTVFQSNGIFRIFVITRNDGVEVRDSDAVSIPPKQNCYRSYRTTTANGHPFITVFSFDYSKTNVKVTFPDTDTDIFQADCFANEKCGPGKAVGFGLLKYGAWFMYLQDDNAHLRNVQITSDNPVYVISGSVFGWVGFADESKDTSMTSLLPSTSWGKEYIVPATVPAISIFTFVTNKTPLNIQFHEAVGGNLETKNYLHKSPHTATYNYGETRNTLAVTANVPFGLYKLFSSRRSENIIKGDVCILSLVPVEMWKSNFAYIKNNLSTIFAVKYHLVTQAHPDDVVFLPDMKKDERVFWEKSTVTTSHITYSVAEIMPPEHAISMYVKVIDRRLMLYVYLQPIKSGVGSLAAYAYDHWLSTIYDKNCAVSKRITPVDGKDNDCDGKIDEELKNGNDDDGDGLIDEDYGEIYSDGQWSEWTQKCDHPCTILTKLPLRVRSCENRSTFGRDCDGNHVQCDEQTCPIYCTNSKCFCNTLCISCLHREIKCDPRCMSGYTFRRSCLVNCPKALTEVGCSGKILSHITTEFIFWLTVVLLGAVFVLTTAAAIYIALSERNDSDSNVEEHATEEIITEEHLEVSESVLAEDEADQPRPILEAWSNELDTLFEHEEEELKKEEADSVVASRLYRARPVVKKDESFTGYSDTSV